MNKSWGSVMVNLIQRKQKTEENQDYHVELLAGGSNPQTIIQKCQSICGSFAHISNKEYTFIAKLPEETRRSLKAIDCIILALAGTNHATLLTFDERLQEAFASL